MDWQPFDSSWLIALAKQQMPNEEWLVEALGQCTQVAEDSSGTYAYFFPREQAKGNSEWDFSKNISLRDPEFGELVLDVLNNGKIGGIEFLDKVRT